MHSYKHLTCIVLFCLFCQAEAQASQKDSLLYAIVTSTTKENKLLSEIELARYYIDQSQHDSATVILKSTILESQQLNINTSEARAYEMLGYNYDIAGNLKQSIDNYEIARQVYEELDDKTNVAVCMNSKGTAAYFQGDYETALIYYLETLEYTKGLGLKKQRANTLNNLGVIYRISEKNRQAITIYNEALSINRELGDLKGVAQQHNNLGVAYTYLYNLDSALLFLDSAMMRYQITQDTYDLAFTYNSFGDAYYEAGKDLKNARLSLLKANELFKTSSNQFSLAKNYLFLGEVELEDNNPAQAVIYLKKGIDILEGTDREDIRLDLFDAIQKAYSELGSKDKAYDYLLAYKHLDAEINAKEKGEYIEEMQTKYDTEKKEKLIEIQNLELQQQQKDKRNLRIILGLLAAGLISSGLFIFITIRTKNLLSKQNHIIENSLQEKDMLLREIHHRVKNNLQVISSILTLQGRYSQDPLIEGAIKKGKDRVRTMALIHENLYQKENLAGVNMKRYMEKLFNSLFHSYNISESKIELVLNIEDINLDVDTVVPIGLAVNELITNALKYAFPDDRDGMIKVGLAEGNNELRLTVEDNGIGISSHQQNPTGTGFGFELIDTFKAKLDAQLNIISKNGTLIEMIIKNYQIV